MISRTVKVRRERRDALGRRLAIVAAIAGSAAMTASCDIENLLSALGLSQNELTGQNAFLHLQVDSTRVPETDMASVLEIISMTEEGGSTTESPDRFAPSEGVVAMLRKTSRPRGNIRPDRYNRFDFTEFVEPGAQKAVFDEPNLDSLQDEYLIPNLEAIPVRDQGMRGTCAAFTGIGSIEYAVLQENPSLNTVDLSEQYFYWASKSECQTSPCNWEGSWYGDGMNYSINASGPDIPLESDCRYVSSPDYSNDTQIPLSSSCDEGAVQVVDISFAVTTQQIIDSLEQGYPVPFASPLSDNWMAGDPIITLDEAGDAGDVQHAAGHAYLIVGYRLLPSMPEEGGMCFILKNSWGTGWGVNGYSCMTLAWMNEWNYGYGLEHPVTMRVDLAGALADGDIPDDDEGGLDDDETYDDETIDDDTDGGDVPDPEPAPDTLTWTAAFLAGPDDRFYKAETAVDGSDLWLRGELRGGDGQTEAFRFSLSGNDVMMDGDVVGRRSGDELTICTGEWDPLCALRYSESNNALYAEFLYNEFRSVKANELPDGNWQNLMPLSSAGFDLEFYRPESVASAILSPIFIRLTDVNGTALAPMRVALDVASLDVQVMGQPVGSINPNRLGLCSGDFRPNCSVFANQTGMALLPNWGALQARNRGTADDGV
jgi:hypothetical protein